MRARRGLLFAGLASFALMGGGQSMYGPGLPAMARAWGIGAGEAGLILSAHSAGCALGVAAMFLRGGAIGGRTAMALIVLGLAGLAAMAGFAVALAGAAAFGAGQGLMAVICNRDFLAGFGARGPSMLALLNAMFGAGAILGPLAFVALGGDPRLAFGLVALLGVGVWLAGGSGTAAATRAPAPQRPFRLRPAILAFGAVAIAVEACLFGLGTVALVALGVGEQAAAGTLSAFFAAFLLARLAMVGLATVVPPFWLFAWGLAAAAGCAALVAQGQVWAFVPLGAAAALFFPGFYVTAAAQMGDDPRVGPTIVAAGLAGGMIAPFAMGRLMDAAGAAVFFPVLAAVALATAALAVALGRGMVRATAPILARECA